MLFPTYQTRDRSTYKTPLRAHVVESLSWDVLGGCQAASISTYGGAGELWNMTSYLGCPVEIVDGQGRRVWWGFVNDVLINSGVTELGLTLDNMANSVQVAYSFVAPGSNEVGTRKTTTAVTNADSITEYGTKEFIVSQAGMADAAATDLAARYLADHKLPQRLFTPGGTGRAYDFLPAQKSTFFTVRLNCRGYFDKMNWRYANVSKTGPSFSTTDTGYNLGDAAANTQMMQQFTVGSTAIYVVAASIYVRRQGSPTDNVTMEIYALDGSGNPTGTALATGASLSYTLMGTGAGTAIWLRDDFTTPVTLSAGVQYGLVIARSGAVNASNYFVIGGDSAAGYTGGIRKTYNPTTWTNTTTDLMFRININALLETTQQVRDLITTYGGTDIIYTDIITASGVSTGANRDGDTTVWEVIKDLLSHGGPNDRRMKATVTAERVLMVEEEEAPTSYAFVQDSGGRLLTTGGSPLPPYMPPVGRWVKIKDAIPGAGDAGLLADATLQFLEGADWSLQSGLNPRYRGQPDVGDIVRLAGSGGY
jgi:hypothetical protein